MSKWINADSVINKFNSYVGFTTYADVKRAIKIIQDEPGIDIVKCVDCRKCKEQGGHANCNGYLYCTRQKTLVDEDCFCSWGEER